MLKFLYKTLLTNLIARPVLLDHKCLTLINLTIFLNNKPQLYYEKSFLGLPLINRYKQFGSPNYRRISVFLSLIRVLKVYKKKVLEPNQSKKVDGISRWFYSQHSKTFKMLPCPVTHCRARKSEHLEYAVLESDPTNTTHQTLHHFQIEFTVRNLFNWKESKVNSGVLSHDIDEPPISFILIKRLSDVLK